MTAAATPDLGQLQLLDLSKVEVSKFNPRQDVGDLTELAESIGQIGVLEPIVVVQRNGHYEAVAGSRRLAASRQAGKKQIPARVMSLDEAQQAAAALIENLQRKDLTPLEEAEAFRKYLDLTGCTQKELGQKIGRAPSTVANTLRLLEAPKPVKQALARGEIDAAHARELLKVSDPGLAEKALASAKAVASSDISDGRVTVRGIQFAVEGVNAQHRDNLVLKTAKADLLAKKADLEATGKIVTWKPLESWSSKEWQVATYLGAPSKRIALDLTGFEGENWKTHDKDCDCNGVALTFGGNYGENAHKIQAHRVCVSPSAVTTWKKKTGRFSGTNRQIHDQRRKQDPAKADAQAVATYERQWGIREGRIARSSEAKKILGRGRLTPDHLRLLVLRDCAPHSPGLLAKVEKMSQTQLERHLVIALADDIAGTVGGWERTSIEADDEFAARHFKVDLKALGYKDRAFTSSPFAPKAPAAAKAKKAKR